MRNAVAHHAHSGEIMEDQRVGRDGFLAQTTARGGGSGPASRSQLNDLRIFRRTRIQQTDGTALRVMPHHQFHQRFHSAQTIERGRDMESPKMPTGCRR